MREEKGGGCREVCNDKFEDAIDQAVVEDYGDEKIVEKLFVEGIMVEEVVEFEENL